MLLFTLFLLVACISASNPRNGSRLIDFGPNVQPKWLPQSVVDSLIVTKPKNWMDITDNQDLKPAAFQASYDYPAQPTRKEEVNRLKTHISVQSLRRFNDMLSAFYTRYYMSSTGVDAANAIFQEFSQMGSKISDFGVEHFKHRFPQPSVVARIAGTGENASAEEIVILAAHEDSVGRTSTGRSPGADDDGSGTSTVLEIFRVLTEAGWKPSRTVEFHTYAGEEAGLLGSQDIASAYQKAGKKVYAMMQLDMTMYPGKNGDSQFGLVTDYTDPKLTEFIRLLVDSYSDLTWVNTRCGYACSDHASWYKAGYQSCFPFEGPFSASSPYIHSADDTIEHISLEHGLQFAYVALGFLVELGQ